MRSEYTNPIATILLKERKISTLIPNAIYLVNHKLGNTSIVDDFIYSAVSINLSCFISPNQQSTSDPVLEKTNSTTTAKTAPVKPASPTKQSEGSSNRLNKKNATLR